MDDAIQNSIGYRLFTNDLVPVIYRNLRGKDGGALPVPVFNDLHQDCPALLV
ncbi:hypothetical protein SAMN04488109_4941, partial [Chryseolinea serpens]